jgi:hypothetical protein
MKLRSYLVVTLLLVVIAGGAAIGLTLKPAEAAITSHEWLNTTYQGEDGFYGADIVAYTASDNAELMARIDNPYSTAISIGSAKLNLGWSSTPLDATEKPATIAAGSYGLVIWNFTVPSYDSIASNLLVQSYNITVQYDITGGDLGQKWEDGGSNLVVYSEDQRACRVSVDKWLVNNSKYTFWGYKGQSAMTEAWYLYNKAEDEYNSGNFGAAKADYAAAVQNQEKAIKSDADSALTPTSAQAVQGTGGMKGVGYLLGGIGILIVALSLGLGIVFWARRR